MKTEMRRKDREMPMEETVRLLAEAAYGILSTVGEDGEPYGVPLSFVYSNEKNAVYFHGGCTGRKMNNIRFEPRVSFTVVGKTQPVYDKNFTTYFESAVISGTASKVENNEEKEQILFDLCEKYLPQYTEKTAEAIEKSGRGTCVYKISVHEIRGKAKRK